MIRKINVFVAVVFCLLIAGCGNKSENSESVCLDIESLLSTFSNEISNGGSLSSDYEIALKVTGDYEYSYSETGKWSDFEGKTITINDIPYGSKILLSLEILKDGNVLYRCSGSQIIEKERNYITLKMERVSGDSIVSLQEKYSSPVIKVSQEGIEEDNSFVIEKAMEVSAKSASKDFPEDAKYIWYMNNYEIPETITKTSSSFSIDLKKSDFVNLGTNHFSVWIYNSSDVLLGTSGIEILIKNAEAETQSDSGY